MWDWISKVAELRASGEPCVLITVVGVQGSAPREVGARMLVQSTGRFHGTIGGGHLEQLAIESALQRIKESGAAVENFPLGAKTGQCCGGTVDLLFEVMGTAPLLYIFGAGHVGQSVARAMEGTAFGVHLIDERDEWIQHPAAGVATKRHAEGWDHFVHHAQWNSEKIYCVVMTHQHDLDFEILCDLLKRETRFVGLIGSESKWRRFRDRLLARGFTEESLSRVQCPVGIETGGKAPAEIALSVGAELLRLHYGKSTGAVRT